MLETTKATPSETSEQPIQLTDNARVVLMKRYVRRGPDGKPSETVEGMFRRVARAVAEPDRDHGADVQATEDAFYKLLTELRFFPNSPTFTGAGTPLGQLAACFVLPISDDMGRDSAGIFQTLRDAALIQQTGGGNGFSFGRLRPKGTYVASSAGQATGPVGFLRVYDKAFGEIAQGGCLLPETLVFTDRGLLRLDEIADRNIAGWQEHRLNVATDEGWRSSPRAYNNGVAPALRVHTRAGLSLAGTYQHRVKVMTDEGPQWRTLQELKRGDWLLVQLGQQRGALQALRQPRREHGNQIWPKLPSVVDEELAFFIGYLTGDGFIASGADDHRVGVSVAHTSYLYEEMPHLMERLFDVTVHRQQKANDRSMTLVVANRAVKEFLQINGLNKARSREANVPRLIRQSPPEIVGAYLRGLFEADGSLSHGYPHLTTTSPRLVEEVATLLIGLGCPVRLWSMQPGAAHYGQSTIYHVRIESTVGLQAWRERIGCDQRSRFVAAQAWESDQRRESTYVLPHPRYWCKPVLEATTLEQIDARGRGLGRNFRSEQPRLRRALLRYTRGERQFTRSAYDELSRQYEEFAGNARRIDHAWFVQVSGVEAIGEALTLDLEVDDNHTYLAYGVVTHNTRRGANMAVLPVHHPDIMDFIHCKVSEDQITNFNISVAVTDKFMAAVRDDNDFELIAPHNEQVLKTVRAREIFDAIVRNAYRNGEPGVLFIDAANRSNPVPHLYDLEATNPCFVGSTRLATDLGLVTIQELAESGAACMVATDSRAPQGGCGYAGENFGVAYRVSSPAWKTRENVRTLKLTTQHGYTVTATPDHKFLTVDRGYVELGDLKQGDVLLLQSGEGVWSRNSSLPNVEYMQEKLAVMARSGDHASGHTVARSDFAEQYANVPKNWSHELGVVVGVLVGDGWLSPNSHAPVGMVFNHGSDEWSNAVRQTMQTYFGSGHWHERSSVRQLTYGRLPFEFFSSLGVLPARAHEKHVPVSLWTAPREAVVGFLQGLFTTDGTVNISSRKKSCSIRLASASWQLLQDVQLMLLNFGIVSRIYKRREAGYRSLPDGKGGRQEYYAHADYELIMDKTNRDIFAREIGFLDFVKQAKAEQFIHGKARVSNAETFETTILSIEEAGLADVYDLTELQTHSVIAHGLVAHQCGEQWLGSYENCCLGSINLAQHVKYAAGGEARVDWKKLHESIVLSTHFLDNVVTANQYVPAVPQLKEAAYRARRIGLGIMGLGDLMYHLGIRYGSEEAQEFAAQVMEFVRFYCMKTSIQLAKDRGAFPAMEGSLYDPKNLRWTPPQSLMPYTHAWGRPTIDWNEIVQGIKKYGIRNAAQTTVAPTGTIATVAGCEAYGCEPVFALAYMRHVVDAEAGSKDGRTTLTYASPLFEQALIKAGVNEATRQRIYDEVMQHGTCQDIAEVPAHIRHTFVVSADITPEEHVRMQAAIQAFVDNSISKTCNCPETATEDDVANAYFLAWELGCKGLTVYVTGTREKVVLETKATAQKKEEKIEDKPTPIETQASKKPRPRRLRGETYRIGTPLGTAFITVNVNGGEQPFEVFLNVGKAGSDTAAVAEAMGRLISLVLRLPSPMSPTERLKIVAEQLAGIGGGRSLGFGPNRVRSLPDGIAQALAEYLSSVDPDLIENVNGNNDHGQTASTEVAPPPNSEPPSLKIGDLCPECGEATYVNEEGCRKCYSCGHSEC